MIGWVCRFSDDDHGNDSDDDWDDSDPHIKDNDDNIFFTGMTAMSLTITGQREPRVTPSESHKSGEHC